MVVGQINVRKIIVFTNSFEPNPKDKQSNEKSGIAF